ncbi:MAG: hypothetical protein AB7O78_01680 [Thermoleophilia bacterium]
MDVTFYAAGLFEGEGYIQIHPTGALRPDGTRTGTSLTVGVQMSDREPLQRWRR